MATRSVQKPRGKRPSESAAIVRALGGRSIVLVGMMGAGKSSIGRRLAGRLGIPFVDADTEIESAAGMTIPEIFDKHGEPYFRAGEARVIARLLDNGPQVLATGGGAVMDQQHPRPHPHQRRFGLAEGRSRRVDQTHQAPQRPPAGGQNQGSAAACANRSMLSPTSSCSRATSRTTPLSMKSSPQLAEHRLGLGTEKPS